MGRDAARATVSAGAVMPCVSCPAAADAWRGKLGAYAASARFYVDDPRGKEAVTPGTGVTCMLADSRQSGAGVNDGALKCW